MISFAVTAPGLEPIVAHELQALGIAGEAEAGGVSWAGDMASLYSASLNLRAASRILVRVAEFRARGFSELERHVRRVDWARFTGPGQPVRLHVTSRKSKLYHQRAIEERFAREIEQALGSEVSGGGAEKDEDDADTVGQAFHIRFLRDRCVVSADASGELLHRRGYRQAVARAPLRETLAAAMLLGIDWSGAGSLLDPFCGSGTIPIEAALIARSIPPALANAERSPRTFAFQRWADFDPPLWDRVVGEARAKIRESATVPIQGSDRDPGAIEAAVANATRAGVAGDISFDVRPISAVEPRAASGWIVTNPPYGVRIGNPAPLRDLYASLGKLLRSRRGAWHLAMLSADRNLERQVPNELHEIFRTKNGGIPVRLVADRADAAPHADGRGKDQGRNAGSPT